MMRPKQERQPGFDQATALAVTGGDRQLLKELADLFQQECPKMLATLHAAVSANDPHQVEIAAHKLKGSTSSFGATRAVEKVLMLERKGRLGDLTGVQQGLAELEEALRLLFAELNAFQP